MADILKPVSERLPFFRSKALKVSLLVDDLRRFRWMEPAWRLEGDDPGLSPGGVAGGDWGWPPARNLSSSDSLRPRTLRFDLGREVDDQIETFSECGLSELKLGCGISNNRVKSSGWPAARLRHVNVSVVKAKKGLHLRYLAYTP